MSDKAERRMLILEAAERLLEHYGVSKTTVADIAREASIGVGTVYLEFGSKDDIIEKVASHKHQIILSRLKKASRKGETWADRLCTVLNERLDAFVALMQCGTHACDLIHCDASPVETAWEAYEKAERELVRDIIECGASAGEFDIADVERATDNVMRAYVCFSPPWMFRHPEEDGVREKLEAMHGLVLRGLQSG